MPRTGGRTLLCNSLPVKVAWNCIKTRKFFFCPTALTLFFRAPRFLVGTTDNIPTTARLFNSPVTDGIMIGSSRDGTDRRVLYGDVDDFRYYGELCNNDVRQRLYKGRPHYYTEEPTPAWFVPPTRPRDVPDEILHPSTDIVSVRWRRRLGRR